MNHLVDQEMNAPRPLMTHTRRLTGQDGFSLIEVMVAMVVLAIGLLAIAAMQDVALSRNVDANELSLVTNLAADMMERIRYNGRNVTAYNGIDTLNAATQPPATQPMARGDYTQWQARLAASRLRGPQGLVTVAATGPANLSQSQVQVQVVWSGPLRNRQLTLTAVVSPE